MSHLNEARDDSLKSHLRGLTDRPAESTGRKDGTSTKVDQIMTATVLVTNIPMSHIRNVEMGLPKSKLTGAHPLQRIVASVRGPMTGTIDPPYLSPDWGPASCTSSLGIVVGNVAVKGHHQNPDRREAQAWHAL